MFIFISESFFHVFSSLCRRHQRGWRIKEKRDLVLRLPKWETLPCFKILLPFFFLNTFKVVFETIFSGGK